MLNFFLKGPAIFTDWEDCSFYIEENSGNTIDDGVEGGEEPEYAVLDSAVEALKYIISGGGALDDSDVLRALQQTRITSAS